MDNYELSKLVYDEIKFSFESTCIALCERLESVNARTRDYENAFTLLNRIHNEFSRIIESREEMDNKLHALRKEYNNG